MCKSEKENRKDGESERKEEEEERGEEREEAMQSEQGEKSGDAEEGLGQDGLRLDPQNSKESKVNVKMNPKVYKPTKAEIEDHD